MKYQDYWDNQEYLAGLRDEIQAAVTPVLQQGTPDADAIAEAVMSQVFARVKLLSWCGRENCHKAWCSHTHYRFEILTHPQAFESPSETGPCIPEASGAKPCVFCQIVAGHEPATVIRSWPDAIAIVPLDPVTDGHTLVIPTSHVRDALENPAVTAAVMRRAAELAPHPCNIITNVGRAATQSVFHLHLHVVPRRENDGLALPWYSGRRRGPRPPKPSPLHVVGAEPTGRNETE